MKTFKEYLTEGLSTEDADKIYNTLVDYITTKMPSDLPRDEKSAIHDEDWFNIKNGGATWNFRNSRYPAHLIAKELNIDITNNLDELGVITKKALRSKEVKAVRQELLSHK